MSDRPSADKDTTFLFRLAEAGVSSARHMLENLAKGSSLANEPAVRAALHLAREYGETRFREQLMDAARGRSANICAVSPLPRSSIWATARRRVESPTSSERAASSPRSRGRGSCARESQGYTSGQLVTEPNYRRVQLGWVE